MAASNGKKPVLTSTSKSADAVVLTFGARLLAARWGVTVCAVVCVSVYAVVGEGVACVAGRDKKWPGGRATAGWSVDGEPVNNPFRFGCENDSRWRWPAGWYVGERIVYGCPLLVEVVESKCPPMERLMVYDIIDIVHSRWQFHPIFSWG